MSRAVKTKGKSRPYTPELSFRVIDGTTIVYVSAVPNYNLTRTFAYIEKQQGNRVARTCVGLLHATDCVGEPGHVWNAPLAEVRQSIETLMVQRYGMQVRPEQHVVRLLCGPKSNPDTAKTALARLKLVFSATITLGLRADQPMDSVMFLPPQYQRRHTPQHSDFRASGKRRTPRGYYRVIGQRVQLELILDNDRLPIDLRAAARRASWPLRDLAILEILIATGARVSEVVEATWAGIGRAGLDAGLRVHNKGDGRSPSKAVQLTSEALDALTPYLTTERPAYDPWQPEFLAWNRGRSWTPQRYLAFLRARGVEPSGVPLFLTQGGTPYTSATFRRQAWTQARATDGGRNRSTGGRVVASPHHIRHWYINRELDRIVAEHGDGELRYVIALQEFVTRMGWASWMSLKHYDHRGVAVAMLRRHAQEFQRRLTEARHGSFAQMEAAGQQAGLLPAPEGIQ